VPELPEVEVLVRHLKPRLLGKTIRAVRVGRARVLLPSSVEDFCRALRGATFVGLTRRGKYMVFDLKKKARHKPLALIGHLGMTGRMYLSDKTSPLPKHTAIVLDLGKQYFVFEDTRYFGRLTLDTSALDKLGPEPLDGSFSLNHFAQALKRSAQPIKVKLLDQSLVAGIGNIYASEALFRVGISPRLSARRLTLEQVRKLRLAIRQVLARAIRCGSTVPLTYDGAAGNDGFFYFGRASDASDFYVERLQVYDRANQPCPNCGSQIRRIVQAARSTFYCPKCQRGL
jgi:formamidopyrimidine-DNA glycosylase